MERSTGGPQAKITVTSSNLNAGNDINLVNVSNTTIHNSPKSSTLTHLKAALNPVTSASYDSYEAQHRSECFPGTRVQVLSDIEAWIYDQSHQAPIYVLDGVAGIGKSTIAQTIAIKAGALGLLGASFFFSRDEDLRKIARHFFPTIAYQLGCFNDDFATCVKHSVDKSPDAAAKGLRQQSSLLILEPLQSSRLLLQDSSKSILLVVDALDECEEESAKELLMLLGQHVHSMKGLKILITMRPESHLRDILDQDKHHEKFHLHDVEDFVVQSDIRLYLESRLYQAPQKRGRLWQPTGKHIDMLCEMCGTLFIIAVTAVKFILDGKRFSPERRLALLLDGVASSDSSGAMHTRVLDETYIRIIFAAQDDLEEIDKAWFGDLNRVLGALIALANPLPCKALASLLDMDPESVEETLSQLHSLVAPSGGEEEMVFRIHHKSFPDFITNRERILQALSRSKPAMYDSLDSVLWVNIGGQHLDLAKACLRIMNRDLKWNLAAISKEDWYSGREDTPDVTPQLISRDLAYASLHWASHLLSSSRYNTNSEVQNDLDKWASSHILTWMEAMVILNQVNNIYVTLQDAIESIKGITGVASTEQLRELLSDASRFVQQGGEVMKLSPIHIYRSCLPFIPQSTPLAKAYHEKGTLKIGVGRSHCWDSLLATLIGHSHVVNSVSFSADGSRLASGSYDGTVRLWDTRTGAHINTLEGHSDTVCSVVFSSDSSQLASGSYDKTIRLWDVKTGAHISTFAGHTGRVRSVAFSGGISRLASGSDDQTIRLWDTKTGSHIFTLTGHPGVLSVTFSIDGSQMASSGSGDGTIQLWDVMTGVHTSTLAGHSGSVNSVAFSNDGTRLASGSTDETIRLWDVKTGVCVSTLTGHSGFVNSVVFSSDDSQLASGSRDNTIRLWDAKTGAHISTLTGHSNAVNSIAFSDDGSRLASASYDSTVRLWDPKQATDNSVSIGHLERVWSIAFSSDGSLLASASADKTIRLWCATTGAHISTLTGHFQEINSIAFSNDGSQLASGSDDRTVRIWDVKTGAHAFTLTGHSHFVYSVAFSPDGSLLASGSKDNTIRLWDTRTGARVSTLSGHTGPVRPVVFSSDGSRLASGSRDDTIRLWDAETGICISIFRGYLDSVRSVALSSNGCMLAAGSSDGTIRIWDASTGAHISTLTGSTTWKFSTIISVVFLQDNFPMAYEPAPRSDRSLQNKVGDHLLALVRRESPPIYGLVMASSPSESDNNSMWNVSVICWFPPDMEVDCLAVDHVHSRVAIGCANGRVMALGFSSAMSLPLEP